MEIVELATLKTLVAVAAPCPSLAWAGTTPTTRMANARMPFRIIARHFTDE